MPSPAVSREQEEGHRHGVPLCLCFEKRPEIAEPVSLLWLRGEKKQKHSGAYGTGSRLELKLLPHCREEGELIHALCGQFWPKGCPFDSICDRNFTVPCGGLPHTKQFCLGISTRSRHGFGFFSVNHIFKPRGNSCPFTETRPDPEERGVEDPFQDFLPSVPFCGLQHHGTASTSRGWRMTKRLFSKTYLSNSQPRARNLPNCRERDDEDQKFVSILVSSLAFFF